VPFAQKKPKIQLRIIALFPEAEATIQINTIAIMKILPQQPKYIDFT
jgi:hypothetical protein